MSTEHDTVRRRPPLLRLLGLGSVAALMGLAGGYAGCGGGLSQQPDTNNAKQIKAAGPHPPTPTAPASPHPAAVAQMPATGSGPAPSPAVGPEDIEPPTGAAREADAGIAGEPGPLTVPVSLYDPSGRALEPFYAALRRIAVDGSKTRIAFFGASHTAADFFTDVIRKRLQARFGDGGPGFVQVGKPWRWHRHAALSYARTHHFETLQVRARGPHHDHYGLGGVALQSKKPWARAGFSMRGGAHPIAVDRIELFYLKQPGGGRARVLVDGKGAKTIRTASNARAPGYVALEVPLASHAVEVRAHNDGPVRVFGAVLERSEPGVVLDTLGVPGSRARYHLFWNDELYRAHLARRNPDLVVLAYGTNEAGDDDVAIEVYEQRVRSVLKRIQQVVPNGACLLVGPSDRPIRDTEAGLITDRPRTHQLIASQRRLAAEHGCAFFDVVAFMGGPLGMVRWVEASPRLGAPDHVHFTRRGYEALGHALHDAMMADYEEETPEPLANGGRALGPTAER